MTTTSSFTLHQLGAFSIPSLPWRVLTLCGCDTSICKTPTPLVRMDAAGIEQRTRCWAPVWRDRFDYPGNPGISRGYIILYDKQ